MKRVIYLAASIILSLAAWYLCAWSVGSVSWPAILMMVLAVYTGIRSGYFNI